MHIMSHHSNITQIMQTIRLKGHRGCVNCINFGFTQLGKLLASGSDDCCVNIYDWSEKRILASCSVGCEDNIFQCKFIPYKNDEQLIVSAADGRVKHIFVQNLEKKRTHSSQENKLLHKHTSACHKVAFPSESNGNIVISVGQDGGIYERDLRQPKSNVYVYVHH